MYGRLAAAAAAAVRGARNTRSLIDSTIPITVWRCVPVCMEKRPIALCAEANR